MRTIDMLTRGCHREVDVSERRSVHAVCVDHHGTDGDTRAQRSLTDRRVRSDRRWVRRVSDRRVRVWWYDVIYGHRSAECDGVCSRRLHHTLGWHTLAECTIRSRLRVLVRLHWKCECAHPTDRLQ
jgi:hypothetical protein